MESGEHSEPEMQPSPTIGAQSKMPDAPALTVVSKKEMPAWLRGLFAGVFLYFFLCAIKVMGSGLQMVGQAGPWLEDFLAWGDQNPFLALFSSVLITSIVQSSSFTTSLIITLVAAGQLKLETAVFAVMGANIGTSVTGIIVALINTRIRRQFRRAFTAALVHDIFNLLTVALLFPLEWITSAFNASGHGFLTQFAIWIAGKMGLSGITNPTNPISVITGPVKHFLEWVAEKLFSGDLSQGIFLAVLGLVMLFLSLILLVMNLKGALLSRIEGLFRRVFFRNDLRAYFVGAVTTVLVQSSSVTTSLIVPLAGAGAVKLKRVFPFMLGANLGTTITGVIAASANPVAAAVAVAICHVTFNLIGTAIWYPLGKVPLGMARWYGKMAARNTKYAILFLIAVFFILPVVGIGITQLLIWLLA